MNELPETGFLRIHQIIGKKASDKYPAIPALIPISRSTFLAGVRSGRYPKPTKALGPRITAWSCESIREYIESVNAKGGA